MSSMAVMTDDHLDKLKIADHAWHVAKSEESEAAAWRRQTIREAREAGHSLKEIAALLDVSVAAVSDIARGRGSRWAEAGRKK